jgi:hypothetical protein
MAKFTVRAFDESFGKWVHIQGHSPGAGIGSMEVSFSVPLAHAAAIGAALIAAAKAAGWDEAMETGREVERNYERPSAMNRGETP